MNQGPLKAQQVGCVFSVHVVVSVYVEVYLQNSMALNIVRGIGLRMWVRRYREKCWHLQSASAVLCCHQNMTVKYVHGIGSEPCED